MICYICRNEVVLPVELICFPCFSVNEVHCNSYVRLCLFCAIEYLQLNKGYFEREFTRKCLTCHETVFLSLLHFNNALKFDFQIIKEDEKVIECPFCFEYQGNMMSVFHHLKQCPEYFCECACKKIIPFRKMLRSHHFNCSHHKHCLTCDTFVPVHDFAQHQRQIHNTIECVHCKEYLPLEELFEHEYYCPERKVECFVCKEKFLNKDLKDHYADHELQLLAKIQDVKLTLSKLFDELVMIQNFRKNVLEVSLLH